MHPPAILLTGASGYVGRLLAAKLLTETHAALVLPVRSSHKPECVRDRIVAELNADGFTTTPDHLKRLIVVPLPQTPELGRLADDLRGHRVTEIIHCAGSADYFDPAKLKAGNIDLTNGVVNLGKKLNVQRLILISTAFASGYTAGLIRETLHTAAGDDPTFYTASKREAEWIVADSGVPYLILRPSIVVGDSRDGRYRGPRFGLYQLWHAAERFMCAEYLPKVHSIAPNHPIPLVHQDALQAGFLAAYNHCDAGEVIHLVSRERTLPTVRDVYDLWMEQCLRPRELHYFDSITDVPMERVTPQERYFIEFANVNLQISSRPWHFETTALDALRAGGLMYADATPETVGVCQDHFIRESARVQRFMKTYAAQRNSTAIRRFDSAQHSLLCKVG